MQQPSAMLPIHVRLPSASSMLPIHVRLPSASSMLPIHVRLPSASSMLPIHVRLPSAYSETDDGDDELDSDSSSLYANADENINENVKKGGRGMRSVQAVRSLKSDSTEDFNKYRSTSNISFQRNILSMHIEKSKSSISDTRFKKNTNQNKIHRLSTRGILKEVDSYQTTPEFTLVSEKQFYDSGTSEDVSDNCLGQVEAPSSSSILKVLDSEDLDFHGQSISDDNLTEAQSLLTSHNAEPSDGKNSDNNGKLFKLSEKAFKSENKLFDSASEIQFSGCFSAADNVNTQSGKVEPIIVTKACSIEGTHHANDLIKEQQLSGNLTNPKSNILLHSSVKLKNNKIATTGVMPRNARRKLQKNNTRSNNIKTPTKSAEVHSELKSSSEHGGFTSESVVDVGFSNKKYDNHILNSRIMATSHSKHDHRSVPVVTVDYQSEESIKELKPNCLRNKVNNLEVKASDSAEQNNHPCSMLTVCKSSKEKNYYEIARRPTSGTVLRECVDIPDKNSQQQDKYVLLKTTKRIEFMPQASEEIISKSIIQSGNQPKLLPVDVKAQTHSLQEYEPVRIKKPRNRISSAPKERYGLLLNRSKATSVPDLSTSREIVWAQNQKNKPKKKSRNVTGKEKPLSAITNSQGGRIASAPNTSLRQKPIVQDSVAEEIQAIQSKMASLGAHDGIEALEKALFTTSGRMVHRHAASYLPSDPSYGLIPHYKHWLPEEYMILQTIKKKLGDDDRHKHLRSLRTAQAMKKLTIGDVHRIIRKEFS